MTHAAHIAHDDKVWTRDDVVALLQTNRKAVVRAIKQLYARQTSDEQSTKTTRVANGRGFNAKDAPFLSDIAKKLPRYDDHMTDRQVHVARKMLVKYWRQLLEVIEENGGQVSYGAKPRTSDAAASPTSEVAASPSSGIAVSPFSDIATTLPSEEAVSPASEVAVQPPRDFAVTMSAGWTV